MKKFLISLLLLGAVGCGMPNLHDQNEYLKVQTAVLRQADDSIQNAVTAKNINSDNLSKILAGLVMVRSTFENDWNTKPSDITVIASDVGQIVFPFSSLERDNFIQLVILITQEAVKYEPQPKEALTYDETVFRNKVARQWVIMSLVEATNKISSNFCP